MRISIVWFVAKRFIISGGDSRFINLISAISVAGIAVGVATLIIAISVLKGFEQTITNKIIDFDSHIKINSFRTVLPDYQKILPHLKTSLKEFNPEIIPFASKLVIVSSKKNKEGLNLIGIGNEKKPSMIKNIVEGSFDLSLNNIVIGRKLAQKLFLKLNDPITVFALSKDQVPSPENIPNVKKFNVSGIFESGMSTYDDSYAYVSLSSAQKLFAIGDNITGYNIRLGDISKIDSLTRFLGKELRYPHAVRSVYQIHRNIFTWIELQKEPIPIVLALIILVAVFNIIGTLLMIVLEKTNAIGLLIAVGARPMKIINIFLSQGIMIGIAGIISGNALGSILILIQIKFNVIKIPSDVYFMSKVPFLIRPDTFILVSVITFMLCILASVIPAVIASRIKPITALRFS
jgi:lipoprotein-releasing system permease protein